MIYLYINETLGPWRWGSRHDAFPVAGGSGGSFFDFGGLFIDKTVRSNPQGDGSQQAGSNAAIESFWRCKFVKI